MRKKGASFKGKVSGRNASIQRDLTRLRAQNIFAIALGRAACSSNSTDRSDTAKAALTRCIGLFQIINDLVTDAGVGETEMLKVCNAHNLSVMLCEHGLGVEFLSSFDPLAEVIVGIRNKGAEAQRYHATEQEGTLLREFAAIHEAQLRSPMCTDALYQSAQRMADLRVLEKDYLHTLINETMKQKATAISAGIASDVAKNISGC